MEVEGWMPGLCIRLSSLICGWTTVVVEELLKRGKNQEFLKAPIFPEELSTIKHMETQVRKRRAKICGRNKIRIITNKRLDNGSSLFNYIFDLKLNLSATASNPSENGFLLRWKYRN